MSSPSCPGAPFPAKRLTLRSVTREEAWTKAAMAELPSSSASSTSNHRRSSHTRASPASTPSAKPASLGTKCGAPSEGDQSSQEKPPYDAGAAS